MWQEISKKLGRRYERCRFDNFEATSPTQVKALDSVKDYAFNIADRARRGDGLILFGPCGTGKDHLLTATIVEACRAGLISEWVNGQELYADLRDGIDREERESSTLRRLAKPDILFISDPLPPFGKITEFQANWLFRILDRRYRESQSTCVTLNVADRKEAIDRLGPQIVDRLIDGALAVHCNWQSRRAPQNGNTAVDAA